MTKDVDIYCYFIGSADVDFFKDAFVIERGIDEYFVIAAGGITGETAPICTPGELGDPLVLDLPSKFITQSECDACGALIREACADREVAVVDETIL